ncbi:hypothetical protein U6V07_12190 [Cutibacterium acnes]
MNERGCVDAGVLAESASRAMISECAQLFPHVVTAKAGTHTPRRMSWLGLVVPTSRTNNHLWLWVPAFAGTTMWLFLAPTANSLYGVVTRESG